MKTNKLIILIFISFFALVFTSCNNKDDETDIDTDSIKELLTAHPWKIESQYLNEEQLEISISKDVPYAMTFNSNGELKEVNFGQIDSNEEWDINEEWNIIDNKLVIDNETFSIVTINSTQLVLSYNYDNTIKELHFVNDEPIDAFPKEAMIGKTYRVFDVQTDSWMKPKSAYEYGDDEYEYELRKRVLIEENTMTLTVEQLGYTSWEIITGTFAFVSDLNIGFITELKENQDIEVSRYWFDDYNDFAVGKTTYFLRECNLWNYLDGPNWVLKEIENNGTSVTDDSLIPLGTIWHFNSSSQMVEEFTEQNNTDITYMPWSFEGTPNDEDVKVNITVDEGINQTFTMLKGNIEELELETTIESEVYIFKFSVETAL